MFFGISGSEFFVLLIVLVVVIGPQRLPEYTRKLTQMVRQLRVYLENAKAQIAQEVGPELADLNLQDLNPRNYDPRKIVREALGEDLDAIRRDLANPFQSAVSTIKESSDEAVSAARGGEPSKPLSQMIEDKKQEALAAKSAAAPVASAPAGQTGQAAQEDKAEDLEEAEEVREAAPAEPTAQAAPEPAGPAAPSGAVPSSLVTGDAQPVAARIRPVSPRDIVRAARSAARTRPEAAAARVDA